MFGYNGIQASSLGVVMRGSNRAVLPPVTPKLITVPGRPGAYYAGVEYGPRIIEVDFSVKADSRAQLNERLRSIASWLAPGAEPAPLDFGDEPGRYYNAIVANAIDIDRLLAIGEGQIEFVCPDPYAYAVNESSAAFAAGAANAVVTGSSQVLPRLQATMVANAADLRLTHVGSGRFVRLIKDLVAGDQVIIDCGGNLVMVNGARVMDRVDLASDFFSLVPGSNTLTLTAGANATVYWRERWL